MKKKILSLVLVLFFASAKTAHAVCPVCTIAVGAGLGLSRFLGIDDSVSGVWVGGLILSTSFWLSSWLRKKNISFWAIEIISVALMYAFVLIPLWVRGVLGHPFNTILGIDKFIFGVIVGSITFLAGMISDRRVRKLKGAQLFSFQRVIFPVGALIIASLTLFIVTSVKISLN